MTPQRPPVAQLTPEPRRSYMRERAQAADALQQKYQLDDMSQATPQMLDELDVTIAAIEARYGVPPLT